MRTLISVLAGLLALSLGLWAQNHDYRPRDTWPYLIEDFTSGAVHTPGGANLNDGCYNVSVVDGSLHFVNNGSIMVADMLQVQYASIGEDMYLNRFGKMEQVVAQEGRYVLLRSVLVDMDSLAKTDIGYGVSSATASTQSLNNLGLFGATVSMGLEAAIAGAKEGNVLPVRVRYHFLLGARQIDADKTSVLGLPGLDRDAAKAFFKQEKIKWNRPESLAKVLKFLADNEL